jgi:hypothetical protein
MVPSTRPPSSSSILTGSRRRANSRGPATAGSGGRRPWEWAGGWPSRPGGRPRSPGRSGSGARSRRRWDKGSYDPMWSGIHPQLISPDARCRTTLEHQVCEQTEENKRKLAYILDLPGAWRPGRISRGLAPRVGTTRLRLLEPSPCNRTSVRLGSVLVPRGTLRPLRRLGRPRGVGLAHVGSPECLRRSVGGCTTKRCAHSHTSSGVTRGRVCSLAGRTVSGPAGRARSCRPVSIGVPRDQQPLPREDAHRCFDQPLGGNNHADERSSVAARLPEPPEPANLPSSGDRPDPDAAGRSNRWARGPRARVCDGPRALAEGTTTTGASRKACGR